MFKLFIIPLILLGVAVVGALLAKLFKKEDLETMFWHSFLWLVGFNGVIWGSYVLGDLIVYFLKD
jgi:hypothetical protein